MGWAPLGRAVVRGRLQLARGLPSPVCPRPPVSPSRLDCASPSGGVPGAGVQESPVEAFSNLVRKP